MLCSVVLCCVVLCCVVVWCCGVCADGDCRIDVNEFIPLLRDFFMASGMSQKDADRRVLKKLDGIKYARTVFDELAIFGSTTLSFEGSLSLNFLSLSPISRRLSALLFAFAAYTPFALYCSPV